MKLGVVFPMALGNDPRQIRDFVQAVEGMGYDYILTYETLVDTLSDKPVTAWQEPFTLLSYIAALTDKLELATGISVLAVRQTVLVAKQAAQLDRLCGGRFRLGVSAGWNKTEFRAMGMDFARRGKRLDEQIGVLRDLWTQPSVTFSGAFHDLENVGVYPQPIQQPIPIWVGGYADVVLRRVAQLGDGWLADNETPETIPAKLDKIKRYREAAGRDPDDLHFELVDVRLEAARDWAQWVQDWDDLGASYMCVTTRHANLTTPQQHIDHFQAFIKAVRG